jgi:hypothetical protein
MSCPLPCSFSHCSSKVVSSALESTCTATVVMTWPKEAKTSTIIINEHNKHGKHSTKKWRGVRKGMSNSGK